MNRLFKRKGQVEGQGQFWLPVMVNKDSSLTKRWCKKSGISSALKIKKCFLKIKIPYIILQLPWLKVLIPLLFSPIPLFVYLLCLFVVLV